MVGNVGSSGVKASPSLEDERFYIALAFVQGSEFADRRRRLTANRVAERVGDKCSDWATATVWATVVTDQAAFSALRTVSSAASRRLISRQTADASRPTKSARYAAQALVRKAHASDLWRLDALRIGAQPSWL